MRAALAAEADRSLPRLIETTQALVRAASPNPPGDTTAVGVVAENFLATIPGIEIRRFEPKSGIVSLLARLRGRLPGRRLIFNGHLAPSLSVTRRVGSRPCPSSARRPGLRPWRVRHEARPCRFDPCSSLLASHAHAWDGEVVLTFAGDEETMGSLGTGHLLAKVPAARGDANICGDVGRWSCGLARRACCGSR